MKEKFSLAIQKMKRKDFLDDFIREKTLESSELSSEASLLRKKNGVRTGTELDLKIYQINAKKATIDKLISKCKAEIKVLKGEIADLLTECYALADKPEIKAKVEAAAFHAFEGKQKLVGEKDAGGIWGNCEIVGAIVTHDKKKKKTTAKLVSAGVVDSFGNYIRRPKIYVYDYDKKQEEGIFHPETDEYKNRVKPGRDHKVLDYIKNTYINVNLIYSLVLVCLYSVFSIWATVGGIYQRFFSAFYYSLPVSLVVAFGLFTLNTLKSGKKGGISDMLPITAILISVAKVVCFIISQNKRLLVLPIALFIYAILAITLRVVFRNKIDGEGENFIAPLAIFLGFALSLVFRKVVSAVTLSQNVLTEYYCLSLLSVLFLAFILGGIFAVIKPNKKIGEIGRVLALIGCTYFLGCLLIGAYKYFSIAFAVVGGILGLLATFHRWKDLIFKNV